MRKTNSEPPRGPIAPQARTDRRIALATGCAALVLYLATLAPTVTGEDSGELIGAAATLGVPHPPGYPVWTVLAHLFSWIPLGNVAWRVNLFSAVCGAGTIALVTLIGIGLTQRRGAAVLGALCLATSQVFWEHALIAEVYTLSTLFMALLLYRCLQEVPPQKSAPIYLTVLLLGVSTGVHSTLVLLLPCYLGMVFWQLPPDLRRTPTFYIKAGIMLALGMGVYAYLPLASLRDPAIDWGDPETLQRWWDVVRRAQYGFMVDQYPRSIARFAGQCLTMLTFWFRDFAGLGALAGALGLALLGRRRPGLSLLLTAMALGTALAAIYMQNFEQNREWHWVMRVFLLPAEVLTAIGITCTLAWLGAGHRNLRGFVMGMAVALLISSLLLHDSVRKNDYTYAEDYGRNILASLPENAIYVPVADHQTFPLLYLQAVEGLRPDVTLLRKYGYLDLPAIPGLLESGEDSWGRFPKRRFDGEILNWVLNNTDRPLFLHPQEATRGLDARLMPSGLLLQALRPEETPQVTPLDNLTWRNALPAMPVADYTVSLIQYDLASASARMAFARGETEAALAHVEAAVTFGHRAPVILHNMGVLCARNEAYGAAAAYFGEILTVQPDNLNARKKHERALELAETPKR